MIEEIPDFHSSGKGTMKRKDLPSDIHKKESHLAQTIYNNPEMETQAFASELINAWGGLKDPDDTSCNHVGLRQKPQGKIPPE